MSCNVSIFGERFAKAVFRLRTSSERMPENQALHRMLGMDHTEEAWSWRLSERPQGGGIPREVASGLSLKDEQGSCKSLPGFIFSFLIITACSSEFVFTTECNTHPCGFNDR